MKAFRIILSVLLVLSVVLVTFRSDAITDFFLESWSLGWMMSYLMPRFLVVSLSILALIFLLPVLAVPRIGKAVIGLFILAACVGGYLAVNLPYINDWSRVGDDISMGDEGKVIEEFLNKDSNYDGLVCLALPNCPYCVASIPKLEKLKDRLADVDVTVLVVAKDSTGVERFRGHVGDTDVRIELAPQPEEFAKLSRGRFPTFLYFKDGKLVHRWSNGQFGYPALDWVEAELE